MMPLGAKYENQDKGGMDRKKEKKRNEKRTVLLRPTDAQASVCVQGHMASQGAVFFVKRDNQSGEHRDEDRLVFHAAF